MYFPIEVFTKDDNDILNSDNTDIKINLIKKKYGKLLNICNNIKLVDNKITEEYILKCV